MSQYPSPYQAPQPPAYPYAPMGYTAAPDLAGPARNAGLLMIILGILAALFAGVVVAVGYAAADPSGGTPEQQDVFRQLDERMQKEAGAPASTVFKTVGGVLAIPAFAMVLLGLFVRKGRPVAVILGIIVTALILFLMVLWLAGALLAGAQGEPGAFMGVCMLAIPLALAGLQIFWLAKAAMNTGPLKVFNEHQQAYQWHMAQQAAQQQQYYQQMYQQQGYNYGTPPPPPPPGQQPPPPPQG